MKKEFKKFVLVLGFCSVVLYIPNVFAQQTGAMKQQVETQLQNYTPAQNQRKD